MEVVKCHLNPDRVCTVECPSYVFSEENQIVSDSALWKLKSQCVRDPSDRFAQVATTCIVQIEALFNPERFPTPRI